MPSRLLVTSNWPFRNTAMLFSNGIMATPDFFCEVKNLITFSIKLNPISSDISLKYIFFKRAKPKRLFKNSFTCER